MNESAAYYESQAVGLGLAYLKSVERAVYLIEESQARWPVINRRLRMCLVRRFPFAVLYYDEPDEILIVGRSGSHEQATGILER